MTPAVRTPSYTICTPANVASAIGCIQVRTPDAETLGGLLARIGIDAPLGSPRVRDLFGIDRGLVVRWDRTTLDMFPHGGPAIVRRLAGALDALGLARLSGAVYPEATDEFEERMLAALASAASPLAVDLLLDQPRRWRAFAGGDLADGALLERLLRPPLVAAVGPANIGKSTLLNALAGRSVSIVADAPGTTRDHVGAMLDLGGLVVRYLDTPGRLDDQDSGDGIDREAGELADRAVAGADLVLLCGDPQTPPGPGADRAFPVGAQRVRVCLRADLGEPGWAADVSVSARDGIGVGALAVTIRDRLVPPGLLADPRPWRFWAADPRERD